MSGRNFPLRENDLSGRTVMCLGWGGVLKSRHLQVVALEHEGVTERLNRAGWSEFWA